jgi:hypothetical protein
MLANSQATFTMLLFCYALHPFYLLHIVYLSPSILQCYVEFDIYLMTTLEKLLGVGSFGISTSLLACCHQVILPTSSRGLGLPLVVQLVPNTFQKC